jgi:N,N'-diacetyllegionaminate synthase
MTIQAAPKIGSGLPCFIIAEAGVNHNGDLEMARRLVDAAVTAGADAVKFQTFKAEQLVTAHAPKAEYQKRSTARDESQLDMLRRLELSAEAHYELFRYCQRAGVIFLSTPFDMDSADFLDELGVSLFKLPSGDITNLPLLSHVARKGKPMIISTGMSYLSEVEMCMRAVEDAGNREIILLHCVSNYPADPADTNLKAMHTMATAFGVPVGYSDHTLGIEIPLAAVAMGACVIEKHITLDRTLPGPDQKASLEPSELTTMVKGIRMVEAATGHGRKEPALSEANTAVVARKSLVAAQDIPAGATLTEGLIAIMRPGTGLPPSMRSYLMGRTVRVPVPTGTLLTLEMLA